MKRKKPLRQNTPLKRGAPLKRTELKRSGGLERSGELKRSGGLERSGELKRSGRLKPRSKKKEAEYVERRKIVERLLDERAYCEACPVFAAHDEVAHYTRRASVDIHEIVRRSQGGSILDVPNLMAVCRECHNRIGDYPQLAFDLGLAKHQWDK